MFEIDLLNGQGRPVRSKPWAIAAATVPFLIPLIAIIVLLIGYATDGMKIRNIEDQISKIDKKLSDMADIRRERDIAQSQIAAAARCNQELARSVKSRTQWSDILSEISKQLPSNVVLYKISANREKLMLKPDESGKPRTAYKFTVMLGAYADVGSSGGESVRRFIDAIKSSPVLGPKIESIKPVSNQTGTFRGREVADYDIECVLRGAQ